MTEKKTNKKVLTVSIVLSAGIIFTGMFGVQDTQAAAKAKAVKIRAVTAKKNTKVTVKYKKQKNASGYQIKFSTSKSFKKSKTVTKTVGKKKLSCSTKRFSAGDTVYVKVRSYKIVNGKKKYGSWSVIKKKTIPADSNNSDSSSNQSDDSTADDSTDSGSADDSTASSDSSSGSASDSSADQFDDSTADDSMDSGSAEDSSGVVSSGSCGATEDDSVTWSLSEDGTVLTISGTGDMEDYLDLTRPWAETLSEKTSIKTVYIEEGVTSIGSRAFQLHLELENISIPESVTSIGYGAFWYCWSMTTIDLPNSITEIGALAFCDSGLTEVVLPNKITKVEHSTFSACSDLEKVVFSDSITSLEEGAFQYCDSLSSITLPDSLKEIGPYAFAHCDILSEVILPDSLESIGDYAFAACPNLESIVIPDGCTVSENAFSESYPTEDSVAECD